MADAADLAAQADRAAAAGDLAGARTLLLQLVEISPAHENWMKLAAMARATGEIDTALMAVHRALAAAPLDFVALLLRASLLEQSGVAGAGEAYGRALAQKPEGEMAPTLARMVDHAHKMHDDWLQRQDARLAAVAAVSTAEASEDEARRIARFRSNTLRTTRTYHSEPSHFHFPGLVEREFHDRSDFPWLAEIEAGTDAIAEEFATVVKAEQAELLPYVQYAEHEPLMQWSELNHNRAWTAIHLMQHGRANAANARHCPRTLALLERVQPAIPGCSPNALFSLLAPHTAIPPHTGVANTRLVCHLPLIVPEGCWFRVGEEKRYWKRGEAFVFDDTIEHEAANPSGELRVVLIFDVWHPGLSATERSAVAAMMEADAQGAALAL